jgi:AhpD family alkylhydroperoxidase
MMSVDYYKVSPGGVKALHALEQYLRASGLQPALIELVKVRASLMNGCAYCVDVPTKDSRAKKPSHLLIVDPVPALIAAMTSAGQVEHVNRQVYEYRRRTLDELKTQGIADVVHPVDLPRVIVFVSAHEDAVMRANALRAGADRILEDAVRQQHKARRSTSNSPQVANFRMGASGRRAPLQNTQKEHRIPRARPLGLDCDVESTKPADPVPARRSGSPA